jgi:hypothetical protein
MMLFRRYVMWGTIILIVELAVLTAVILWVGNK